MNIRGLIAEIDQKLSVFEADFESLTLRAKVLRLVSILQSERALSVEVLLSEGITPTAAREKLRVYFVKHVGIVLDAIELEVVSGISDYGRRIRELRVVDGYKILTGAGNDPEEGLNLMPSQYLLIRAEPDNTAARRWQIANRIRKETNGGSQGRILRFLQANVGQVVTTEEIIYVGRATESPRRARELRTEKGYAVATRFTGRPDLKQGEYVLENEQITAEPHDRQISHAVAIEVFARDQNKCRVCGWEHSLWTRQNPRFLELHHFEHHEVGGKNIALNLLVLCNVCHDSVHAGRTFPPEP
jgi:hypothetical protein